MVERPKPSVSQIRSVLENNPHVNLVGDLQVVAIYGYSSNYFGARRDFYVEPKNPPAFGELTDFQVDVLNAAAYYKRQPTRALTTIPRQFAELYNQILQDALPVDDQYQIDRRAFGYVSNLASARIYLGFRQIAVSDRAGSVHKRIETKYEDPQIQAQAERIGQLPVGEIHESMDLDVRVRLFTPGMGDLVYRYEKGFYLDGNVVEWNQDNLVYKGRYIATNQLSPEQLQAIGRGEFPFPQIEYLETSEFEGDSTEAEQFIRKRIMSRGSDAQFVLGRFAIGADQEVEGDFDKESYLATVPRTGDPSAVHSH